MNPENLRENKLNKLLSEITSLDESIIDFIEMQHNQLGRIYKLKKWSLNIHDDIWKIDDVSHVKINKHYKKCMRRMKRLETYIDHLYDKYIL